MSGTEAPPRARVGVGVAAGVWFGALLLSVVVFQVVVAATGYSGEQLDLLPFWLFPTVSMLALWIPTLVLLWVVSRRRMTGSFVKDFTLRFRWIDLVGVPVGVLSQLAVLQVVYWPFAHWFPETFSREDVERAARDLTERASGSWRIVLVVAVVVCAPLVEELLYRGLILGSLSGSLARPVAVVVSALWFAASHLQPVQFIGLFVFGVVLGACRAGTRRLGMGVLAHAAFNATSVVILWPRK